MQDAKAKAVAMKDQVDEKRAENQARREAEAKEKKEAKQRRREKLAKAQIAEKKRRAEERQQHKMQSQNTKAAQRETAISAITGLNESKFGRVVASVMQGFGVSDAEMVESVVPSLWEAHQVCGVVNEEGFIKSIQLAVE